MITITAEAIREASDRVTETVLGSDLLEAALAEVRQLILVPRETRGRANFYLGLDPASPLAPTLSR